MQTATAIDERQIAARQALENPDLVDAELCKRKLFNFFRYFWDEVSHEELVANWHIPFLCSVLQEAAERVARGEPKKYDILINVPPGTSKSTIATIMFPAWCWTRWPWMRFITSSYSAPLALKHAEFSRDVIQSTDYIRLFHHLQVKQDQRRKSDFRITYWNQNRNRWVNGGNRFSTSVGGTVTGMHGHILLVDDPINPQEAVSDAGLDEANKWLSQTLSTRKVDKAVTVTIYIMQRLSERDPAGDLLNRKKGGDNLLHICLPGEIRPNLNSDGVDEGYAQFVKPQSLIKYYKDGLLDPKRMSWDVLQTMREEELGQFGYAGQIGQNPVPPSGGMFRVNEFKVIDDFFRPDIVQSIRYWDKAATPGGGSWTVGCLMHKMKNGTYIIEDVVRGQWDTDVRENVIKATAELDGERVHIYMEQEPGSGGKDSVRASIRSLAGFHAVADPASGQGDKTRRADHYSVQVNAGNVALVKGSWNHAWIEEHRFFPRSRYKDQVDSGSGAFNRLSGKKKARNLRR